MPKPVVYICAPYSGDVPRNVAVAKAAAKAAIDKGYVPVVPHLLYPAILDDNDQNERALGIDLDIALIDLCSELWAYGPTITPGMKKEIDHAMATDKPVIMKSRPDGSAISKFLPELEIQGMLTLSTVHISEATAKLLQEEPETDALCLSVYEKRSGDELYGWFVYLTGHESKSVPGDLAAIISLARRNDCGIICLDSDGPVVPSLTVYNSEN